MMIVRRSVDWSGTDRLARSPTWGTAGAIAGAVTRCRAGRGGVSSPRAVDWVAGADRVPSWITATGLAGPGPGIGLIAGTRSAAIASEPTRSASAVGIAARLTN